MPLPGVGVKHTLRQMLSAGKTTFQIPNVNVTTFEVKVEIADRDGENCVRLPGKSFKEWR
jgi:hypothetical protein